MESFHDIPTLHSDLFGSRNNDANRAKVGMGTVVRSEISRPAYTAMIDSSECPPPLMSKPTDAQFRPTSISSPRHGRLLTKYSSDMAGNNEVLTYDHHCKYSFMRSQLSRLLCDRDVTDISCISPYSDPNLSDFIDLMRQLDQESTERLVSILQLRIRNS